MSESNYTIHHYYQPTNTSCGPTSLAMIFSYYGKERTPEEVIKEIPVIRNKAGEDCGTSGQQLAIWCLAQGFHVDLYSADFQLLDLSWSSLSKAEMLERLTKAIKVRIAPAIGKDWSSLYLKSYIEFIKSGGTLHIDPYISSSLLNELLENGPVVVTVNFNVLHSVGRTTDIALRKSRADDINGKLANHFVVLYGREHGSYLIDDPWEKPGKHIIEPERLVASISAAQMECDSLIFQLSEKQ